MTSSGILIVDDNEMNRDLLARRLRRRGFAVVAVADGPAALEALERAAFDAVLLDIEMPRMSGLDVLRRVRERHAAIDLPVIMVSARHDSQSIVRALDLGANDYVTKPIEFPVALARLNAQLSRRRFDAIRRATDALTGLPNRASLIEWSKGRDDRARRVAVIALNLDRFRVVNNGLGRAVGDRLLVDVATRLQPLVPAGGRLARADADDFLCLLHGSEIETAIGCVNAMLEAVRRPFEIDRQRIAVTASAGLACGESAEDAEALIDRADTALYRAKTLSGNRWEMFAPALHSKAAARLQLEMELQRALAEGAFVLRYEPIVDLASGAVAGLEALVRWNHPQRGEIGPAEFIPIAEETGLIVPLGQLIFRAACEQLREWRQTGSLPDGVYLSINASARQLDDPAFIDDLRATLAATDVDACRINLEITESALMEQSERTRLVVERLRALGTRVALDDFGTGYSSLSYLQSFAVNTLKIDRSFVQGLSRTDGGEIVRTVVRLGHTLGMNVVAEGVEEGWQLDGLRSLGCSHAQGYLFCRPLTAEAAVAAARERFPVTQ